MHYTLGKQKKEFADELNLINAYNKAVINYLNELAPYYNEDDELDEETYYKTFMHVWPEDREYRNRGYSVDKTLEYVDYLIYVVIADNAHDAARKAVIDRRENGRSN